MVGLADLYHGALSGTAVPGNAAECSAATQRFFMPILPHPREPVRVCTAQLRGELRSEDKREKIQMIYGFNISQWYVVEVASV